MSVQISVLTERLQKKEEDIEEMNSGTKGLDGPLKKIEEEVEQQITNRQDNIVFFGGPEKEGRESSDDYASTMVTLLKAGLYKLGSRGGSLKLKKKKNCLVKCVPQWNILHTTKTSQTGQATSSLQRSLDPSTSGWLLLLFLYIPDGASPSNCCTLEQTIPG